MEKPADAPAADTKSFPPCDVFVPDDYGMVAWRPVFETIRVLRNALTGNKILIISKGEGEIYRRELTKSDAEHLANLLRPQKSEGEQ